MPTKCQNFIDIRNQNTRTAALIGIGLIYLFFGAFIFHTIEQEQERLDLIRLTEEEAGLQHKYNISNEDMGKLAKVLIDLEPYKAATQWDYTGSLYFSIIVLTTIGYGHSVPHTVKGKIFCMIYSLIGVPLYLVMFQAMGERINNAAKYAIKKVGRKLGLKCSEISLSTLVPFGFFSCVLTVTIGTVAFSNFEGWSTLDSVYYCVVTLTTIGFGDYVPLQEKRALEERPTYVVFSFIYILVGLTIIGAFVNLVVLRLMVTTATGEPPKEEETQVDGFADSAISSSYHTQTSSGCNPYGSDEDHRPPGEDNGGLTLPGMMNGDIRNRYSIQRGTRSHRSSLFGGDHGYSRRQHSFNTSREERYREKSQQTSRYSDGVYYNLYRDIEQQQQQPVNNGYIKKNEKRSSVIPQPENNNFLKPQGYQPGNLESGGSYTPTFIKPCESEQIMMSQVYPPLQTRNPICDDFSNFDCVVCQKTCLVCSKLFSLHLSLDDICEAKLKSKQISISKNLDLQNMSIKNVNKLGNNLKRNGGHKISERSCSDSVTTRNTLSQEENFVRNRPTSFRQNTPMDSDQKMFLEVNPIHRSRNLSMDSGYEGMVNECSIQENFKKRSRSVNLDKPSKYTSGSVTDRPSFLSLTSPPEPSDVFSLEVPKSINTTSSIFLEPDFISPKAWTSPYSSHSANTEKIHNTKENEENGNYFTKSKMSFERQTWPPVTESKSSVIGKEQKAQHKSLDKLDSNHPAIVVTLYDENICIDENKVPNNTKDETTMAQVAVDDAKNANRSVDQTSSRTDFIGKMCAEHQAQYQFLYKILSDSNNIYLKNKPYFPIKKDTENMTFSHTSHLSVPVDKNTKSMSVPSLPTTKLCSNGSVVTDYSDTTLLYNGHTPQEKSNEIRRAYSCSTADQKLQQQIYRLSQSFRGRIKSMDNHTKYPMYRTISSGKQRSSPKLLRSGKAGQNGETRHSQHSSKKNLSLPILEKTKRRKKTKLDMIRMFLLKNKQNGRRRANVSTVYKEKQTEHGYNGTSPTNRLGGSDPYLKKIHVHDPVHSASTQSLPNSSTLSIHIRNGKTDHNPHLNGKSKTYTDINGRNVPGYNHFDTDIALSNEMAIY